MAVSPDELTTRGADIVVPQDEHSESEFLWGVIRSLTTDGSMEVKGDFAH